MWERHEHSFLNLLKTGCLQGLDQRSHIPIHFVWGPVCIDLPHFPPLLIEIDDGHAALHKNLHSHARLGLALAIQVTKKQVHHPIRQEQAVNT